MFQNSDLASKAKGRSLIIFMASRVHGGAGGAAAEGPNVCQWRGFGNHTTPWNQIFFLDFFFREITPSDY